MQCVIWAHLLCVPSVVGLSASLWVMGLVVETTLRVPHECGQKTNGAHQYLPAVLWPQQMKMNDRAAL